MGKVSTSPTIAGRHALTHQVGGEDVIVGIAPGAHAATHILAGADPIILALDARAIALAAQGEIVYHAAAVNTLAALAVGVAGQALLSGGPAANPLWGAPAPAAHEATHVAGGADDIDAALDARALGLTAQGEIVYHAAAANTLATLAVGAAGQALLSGGPAANVTWGAPAPAAHEPTHVRGGTDDIDAALDARAIALANQGEIVFHAAAATTLSALATGVAGQALLTGGAGADPSWGAPVPAAHVLATTGPHTNELPLTDLAAGAQGEIITRTVADWAALGVGAAGQALLSGGAGADVSWGAPAPATHESTHVSGGADDIDSTLDGRAVAFSEQGDIVYASAATTISALVHGTAGQALLSGGHGANPSWGAPAPAAHVLDTTGPHTGTLLLADLEVGARGEIITRTVADWAALGVGAAGQALLSGGAGADVSWGAPAPAAHVLDTTGPHTGTLLLADLEVGARGEIITRTVADWAALGVGAAGQALLSGGAGADVSWGAPAVTAHEATHVSGGADDIDSALDGRAITLTTQGDIVYASGVNTLARLGAGVSGQFLMTQGGAANPIWADATQFTYYYYSAALADNATYIPAQKTIVMTAQLDAVDVADEFQIWQSGELISRNSGNAELDYGGFFGATMCDGSTTGYKNRTGGAQDLTLVGMTLA